MQGHRRLLLLAWLPRRVLMHSQFQALAVAGIYSGCTIPTVRKFVGSLDNIMDQNKAIVPKAEVIMKYIFPIECQKLRLPWSTFFLCVHGQDGGCKWCTTAAARGNTKIQVLLYLPFTCLFITRVLMHSQFQGKWSYNRVTIELLQVVVVVVVIVGVNQSVFRIGSMSQWPMTKLYT